MSSHHQNTYLIVPCYLVCRKRLCHIFVYVGCFGFLNNELFLFSIPQRTCKQKPDTSPAHIYNKEFVVLYLT